MRNIIFAFLAILIIGGCGSSISSETYSDPSRGHSDSGLAFNFDFQVDRINMIDYTNNRVEVIVRANSTDSYSIVTKQNGWLTINSQAGNSNTSIMFFTDRYPATVVWFETGFPFVVDQLNKFDVDSYVELYINGLLIEKYYLANL